MTELPDYEITTENISDSECRITLKSELGFSLRVMFHDPDIPKKHPKLYFQYRLFAEYNLSASGEELDTAIIHAAGNKPLTDRLPWRRDDSSPRVRLGKKLHGAFGKLRHHYRRQGEKNRMHIEQCITAFGKRVKQKREPEFDSEIFVDKEPIFGRTA